MSIDSTGRRCKCGNYGCLEAYASGSAIADRAVEGIDVGTETRLPDYVNGDLGAITAQVVYDAAQDGDEYALEVIEDTARFLGTGVANLLNIFNPEIVVVCGGVTAAGERLFAPLRKEVARRAFKPAVEVCRIVPGELPGTAAGARREASRRDRHDGVGHHLRSRRRRTAGRGMGRDLLRAGRTGSRSPPRMGDRSAHQGRERSRSHGERVPHRPHQTLRRRPVHRGPGAQQPGHPTLLH
jgi:hypothetical protein